MAFKSQLERSYRRRQHQDSTRRVRYFRILLYHGAIPGDTQKRSRAGAQLRYAARACNTVAQRCSKDELVREYRPLRSALFYDYGNYRFSACLFFPAIKIDGAEYRF